MSFSPVIITGFVNFKSGNFSQICPTPLYYPSQIRQKIKSFTVDFSMKQLQLQGQLWQHYLVLDLKLHHASSPCKLSVPFGFPPARSNPLPRLCFSSQPFNKTCTHSRLICKMTKTQFEIGKPEERHKLEKRANGIFWIILLNLGIYIADHIFQVRAIKALYLYHNWPAWYQFITATFCHVNWQHLSSNLFFLYIFGKLVEEEEGNFALWLSYILTGVGANLVSWLVLPRNAVSIGASGAVFGLFAISVLVKMSWDWRKILEVLILGQFVIEKVMEAAQASAGLAGNLRQGYALQSVNHIAHLSGALIGVFLIWLLSRFPSEPTDVNTSSA